MSSALSVFDRERATLAPYAMFSADSAGRKHPQEEHPYRGPFQRDRDRIVHASAWRRLSGKMQVFTGDRGDYHRTRLTHTMEVASIARTIGRALRLNEDLIEALALLHDLGHPPFGHAGEDALAECLAAHGGFSHNRHALTIVEELEIRYPEHPGLNLTREVLSGQATRIDKTSAAVVPLLEVQVVETADSITYDAHDTDDAVKLGLVTLEEFEAVPLAGETLRQVRERYGPLEPHLRRKTVVREMIDRQVVDVIAATTERLAQSKPATAAAARRSGWTLGISEELARAKEQLEDFLYQRVYRHAELLRVRENAQRQLKRLFAWFAQHPREMPEQYQQRAAKVGLPRAVGDYLAGMTDRFCIAQFERLT
jgi:dGTPase